MAEGSTKDAENEHTAAGKEMPLGVSERATDQQVVDDGRGEYEEH